MSHFYVAQNQAHNQCGKIPKFTAVKKNKKWYRILNKHILDGFAQRYVVMFIITTFAKYYLLTATKNQFGGMGFYVMLCTFHYFSYSFCKAFHSHCKYFQE